MLGIATVPRLGATSLRSSGAVKGFGASESNWIIDILFQPRP